MDEARLTMAQKVAQVAGVFQHQTTGHAPKAVLAALCGDTLVITLHNALTPAEEALARRSPKDAARVQAYYRQLFASSADSLHEEIKRVTGVAVREAAVKVDTATGAVVHAFTSGSVVQVFLLARGLSQDAWHGNRPVAAAAQGAGPTPKSGWSAMKERERPRANTNPGLQHVESHN